MSDKPDIRIVVGADIPKTKSVVKDDLKVVAKQINQEQTVANVKLGLDVNATKKLFQDKLNAIIGGLKLDKVKIDLSNSIDSKPVEVKVNTDNIKKQVDSSVEYASKEIAKLNKEFIKKDSGAYYDSFINKNKEALKSLNENSDNTKLVDTSIKEYENTLNKIRSIINSLDEESLLNNKELAQSVSLLKQQENIIKNTLQVSRAETRSSNNTQKEINRLKDLINTIDNYLETNDRAKRNQSFMSEVASIRQEAEKSIHDGEKGINLIENSTDRLVGRFSSAKQSVKSFGLEGQKWTTRLSSQFEKLGVYFSAATVMMGAWRQVKQMVSNVIELDAAMTELKKVTNETDVAYTNFLENAEVRAKKLGATLTDTIRASADAARMGFSLNESEVLSDTFLTYLNVGDGIKDVEQASSSVISALKAFSIEAKNSMQIVDAYNEVSNTFAVRSDEIGLAVADMGAAFAGAGNSMEESIAVYTGMNEIIQDWSKSSTAMRTIAARLRNTAGELEELGIDAEGAAESVTKLQTQLLNITKGKVDIMISPDEFKSTTQILRELAAVWESLTDKDRADVTRLVSGTRQQSTLQAVLTNWEQVEAAITTAMDSEGSAYVENAKYLDSINGRISQFKASYEALSNTLIDDGAIKNVVSGGTSIINVLDSIIDKLGAIPTLIIAASGGFSALSNKGWLKNLSDKRAYALLQSGGNTERADMFSKRLYGNTSKWLITKVISSVDNNTDGKVLLIA